MKNLSKRNPYPFVIFIFLLGCRNSHSIEEPNFDMQFDCSQLSPELAEKVMTTYEKCLASGEISSQAFYQVVNSCDKSVKSFFCKPVSHE